MDPRCYFSTTPVRKLKQSVIDSAKQRARQRLLRSGAPKPLLAHDQILQHYDDLMRALRALPAAVTMLGLLPPDEQTFPGSAAHFMALNESLSGIATAHGADFLDWRVPFSSGQGGLVLSRRLSPRSFGHRSPGRDPSHAPGQSGSGMIERSTADVTAIVTAYRRQDQVLNTLRILHECDPSPAEVLVHVDGGEHAFADKIRAAFPHRPDHRQR
jgi:hypothetical protein